MQKTRLTIEENARIAYKLNELFWSAYHQSEFDFRHYYQDLLVELMPYFHKAVGSNLDTDDIVEIDTLMNRLQESAKNQEEGL